MSSVLGSPLLDAIMILCPFILVGIERLTHTWLVSPSALMWFAGLFSMGHFVPGFVRCYEDETLFQRYATRLCLVPLGLLLLVVTYSHFFPVALGLIAILWRAWHGMMQFYGIGTMYSRRLDAESNRRIEYFFYVSWFAYLLFIPGFSAITGLLPHTNPRLDLLLDTLARLRPVFGVVACLATVVVGMHDLVAFRRGENISLWKYSFMASTCGTFLILAQAVQTNFLLYLFLAEIIHGAQYFLVTWANGIRTPPLRQTWFMRWMPTSSLMRLVLVLVIVALCVPNGSLVGLGLSHVPGIQLLRIGTTISLLHYYFDGFAWKTPPQKIGRGLFEIIDFLRQTGVVFAVFAAAWAFDWAFL